MSNNALPLPGAFIDYQTCQPGGELWNANLPQFLQPCPGPGPVLSPGDEEQQKTVITGHTSVTKSGAGHRAEFVSHTAQEIPFSHNPPPWLTMPWSPETSKNLDDELQERIVRLKVCEDPVIA